MKKTLLITLVIGIITTIVAIIAVACYAVDVEDLVEEF